MANQDKESGEDKRIFPRAPMLLKVEYSNAAQFLADYTENISEGGVFIITEDFYQKGAQLDFSVSFPGLLDPIQVRGEVMWRREARSPGEPAGIGVRFLLDQSPDRASLVELVSRLRSRERPAAANARPVNFRVLLVEDNVVVRDMLRYGIQKLCGRSDFPGSQLEVVEADNGREALEHLQKGPYHLVVVDLYMPIMDGGQLIEHIRANPSLAGVPVLVVSSGGREGRVRAMKSGADVYLDKPIKLKQMMETIETLLAIGHTPRGR
ncbi:MAG TPA: TIGR02266 family protein [Myxococcota bacterium]|nr:TIGR02266 family protein [Myxococcota bacterium]HRY97045.1 TIGR02266 family protein [Myxococcota bacterium]